MHSGPAILPLNAAPCTPFPSQSIWLTRMPVRKPAKDKTAWCALFRGCGWGIVNVPP